jgi:hypothetical protein
VARIGEGEIRDDDAYVIRKYAGENDEPDAKVELTDDVTPV